MNDPDFLALAKIKSRELVRILSRWCEKLHHHAENPHLHGDVIVAKAMARSAQQKLEEIEQAVTRAKPPPPTTGGRQGAPTARSSNEATPPATLPPRH